MRELAYRHGLSVRPDPDFHNDVDRLIRGIKDVVSKLTRCRLGRAAIPSLARPGGSAEAPGRHRPGRAKSITNSIGMKLVLIPAGEFLMGSPDSRPGCWAWREASAPGKYHAAVLPGGDRGDAGSVPNGAVTGQSPSYFTGSDDLPVENVCWDDAIAFCKKLTELENEQFGSARYRLPTEAEWEYACRAGSKTRYSFGDDPASLGEFAWYGRNSDGRTHPVGQKRPNAFELHDMHGNVWEWCQDGYNESYYGQSPGADPPGPSQAAFRVFRGGSWYGSPLIARSAIQGRIFAGGPERRHGFPGGPSPVCSLSQEGEAERATYLE